MSAEWRAPAGEVQLTGRVVYRCWACGTDIPDEEVVFADEAGVTDLEHLTKTTRSYHPSHVPPQED
jgi:hypothetical protein